MPNSTAISPHSPAAIEIGYLGLIDPGAVPSAEPRLQHALNDRVHWHVFNSGPGIIAALAAGSIQIGNIGSVPLATALSRRIPLQVFMIASYTGAGEALVVRTSIHSGRQLRGHLIATPFGSTAHYSLLQALAHWGLSTRDVTLVNLNPGDIAAAWRRGDIDGAYLWSPALDQLKTNGHVLIDSSTLAAWGAPTFNVWVARTDFAAAHPELLRQLTQLLIKDYSSYNRDPQRWSQQHAAKISQWTGVAASAVPTMLAGSRYPEAAEQVSAASLNGGAALQIAATAQFLAAQNVIPHALPDYRASFSPQAFLGPSAPAAP